MNQMISAQGQTVVVYTTNTRYTWTTDWMPCLGLASADVLLNVRNRENSWQGKPCYQTAAVLTEYPDAATVFAVGSYASSNGFVHFRETLGLTTKLWIRFGIAASNTSGVSIGSADVDMVVAVNGRHARGPGEGGGERRPSTTTRRTRGAAGVSDGERRPRAQRVADVRGGVGQPGVGELGAEHGGAERACRRQRELEPADPVRAGGAEEVRRRWEPAGGDHGERRAVEQLTRAGGILSFWRFECGCARPG